MAAQFSEFRLAVDICQSENENGWYYGYYDYFTDTDFECNVLTDV